MKLNSLGKLTFASIKNITQNMDLIVTLYSLPKHLQEKMKILVLHQQERRSLQKKMILNFKKVLKMYRNI